MKIIDGRKIRDEVLLSLKERVSALPFQPVFCDVLVGGDPASAQYVRMKEKTAESLGIKVFHAVFPADIESSELIQEIKRIGAMPHMSGLIVQLPLPPQFKSEDILNVVPSNIDVDATGKDTSEKFYNGTPDFIFPTAAAIITLLDSLKLDFSNKKVVVVGQGNLVGKPVTHLLKKRGLDVTTVDKFTENPEEIFKNADVIVTGVGKGKLINGNNIKKGVVIIDAGTSESNGGVVGDVDRESVEEFAEAISPVPGGVGPVTVSMLMNNVVISAERMAKK